LRRLAPGLAARCPDLLLDGKDVREALPLRRGSGFAGNASLTGKRVADGSMRCYAVADFVACPTILPGIPFTDKPFADIIRADVKQALVAKATPTARTYRKKGSARDFMRTVGGKTAAN
jgi:hypothetical protein